MKKVIHHINFQYKGKRFSAEITTDSSDEWGSFTQHRMTFDFHYDEEWNHIVVYRVRYNKADYSETIHTQPIKA